MRLKTGVMYHDMGNFRFSFPIKKVYVTSNYTTYN